MDFYQIIERANAVSPSYNYHIFGEYDDGKRGYFKSYQTLAHARSFAAKIRDPLIYDRAGNDVDEADDSRTSQAELQTMLDEMDKKGLR